MRLAGEEKMGYYPVNLKTIDLLCRYLVVPDPKKVKLIDVCCGAGMALEHLGKSLGVPKENLYGVELDNKRSGLAAERLGHVVHSSFFAVRIVPVQSFSLAWVNPPYDNELKQEGSYTKSLEVTFVEHAARYIDAGGLIVLHCPADRVTDAVKMAMNAYFEDVVGLRLPQELRPYREMILVGVKRKSSEKNAFYFRMPEVDSLPKYELKKGEEIRAFDRLAPTDAEVMELLEKAPFWKPFHTPPEKSVLRPILPLGPGHLGLTLASGYLDGYIAPEGVEPHVVRGIAYKEEQTVKEEQSENDDGKVTTTTTKRENIKLKIRAVNADGIIHEIK